MTIIEYQNAVVELFRLGAATDEQWREMASAVLEASESEEEKTIVIDRQICGVCAKCGEILYEPCNCQAE